MVRDGAMSSKILAAVGRPLMALEEYVQNMNRLYQQAIAASQG